MSQFDEYSVSTEDGVLGHRFHAEIGGGNLQQQFDVDHIDVPPATGTGNELGSKFDVGTGARFRHRFSVEVGNGSFGHRFFMITPRSTIHFIAASLTGTSELVARTKGLLKLNEQSSNEDVASHKFHVTIISHIAHTKHYVGASNTETGGEKVARTKGLDIFVLTNQNEDCATHKFHVIIPEFLPADYHFIGASNTESGGEKVTRIKGVNKFTTISPNESVAAHKFHVVSQTHRGLLYHFVGASRTGGTGTTRIYGLNKFETSPDVFGHEFNIAGIEVDGTKPQDLGQTLFHKFIVRGNYQGSEFGVYAWAMPPEFGVFTQESDWPTGQFDETEEDC